VCNMMQWRRWWAEARIWPNQRTDFNTQNGASRVFDFPNVRTVLPLQQRQNDEAGVGSRPITATRAASRLECPSMPQKGPLLRVLSLLVPTMASHGGAFFDVFPIGGLDPRHCRK